MKQFKEIIVGIYDGGYYYSIQVDGIYYDGNTYDNDHKEIQKIHDIVRSDHFVFEKLAENYPKTRIICVDNGCIDDTGVR